MLILGITGGVAQKGDFYQIATTTLTGSAASIEFTSIPATYTHLQIRGILRATSGSEDEMLIRFNSDTGTNYSTHQVFGGANTTGSGGAVNSSSMYGVYTTGGAAPANVFGAIVMDILDYSNTNKYKTMRNISGYNTNAGGYALMRSGNWRSTSAISSIQIFCATNIAQYSSLALYGVKA